LGGALSFMAVSVRPSEIRKAPILFKTAPANKALLSPLINEQPQVTRIADKDGLASFITQDDKEWQVRVLNAKQSKTLTGEIAIKTPLGAELDCSCSSIPTKPELKKNNPFSTVIQQMLKLVVDKNAKPSVKVSTEYSFAKLKFIGDNKLHGLIRDSTKNASAVNTRNCKPNELRYSRNLSGKRIEYLLSITYNESANSWTLLLQENNSAVTNEPNITEIRIDKVAALDKPAKNPLVRQIQKVMKSLIKA
jgi:hypothetical protein